MVIKCYTYSHFNVDNLDKSYRSFCKKHDLFETWWNTLENVEKKRLKLVFLGNWFTGIVWNSFQIPICAVQCSGVPSRKSVAFTSARLSINNLATFSCPKMNLTDVMVYCTKWYIDYTIKSKYTSFAYLNIYCLIF